MRRWSPVVLISLIIAVVAGYFVWSSSEHQNLLAEMERKLTADRMALENFDLIKDQFPLHYQHDLQVGHCIKQYWTAEAMVEQIPTCTQCLYALALSSRCLSGYYEALSAANRIVELLPENAAAQAFRQECAYYVELFDRDAASDNKRMMSIPSSKVFHQWAPIAPLKRMQLKPETEAVVRRLQELWRDMKEKPSLFREVLGFINREWAVETGRIEGLYELSADATRNLIYYGLSEKPLTSGPFHVDEQGSGDILGVLGDQYRVINELYEGAEARSASLNEAWIKKLQWDFTAAKGARFTKSKVSSGNVFPILIRRGEWKNQPNFPQRADGLIHQNCPYPRVPLEMKRLLAFANRYEREGVAPHVLAAWLHHRFMQILPFHGGNGRVAHALASLVLVKHGLLPMTVRLPEREVYDQCLQAANQGNLQPLVEFIVDQQRATLLDALKLSKHQTLVNANLLEGLRSGSWVLPTDPRLL